MDADGWIEIRIGDITKLAVDAIVNAANQTLLGGGGVDGAIHRAAGPELKKESAALNGCATGDARITAGYNLPADHVIHTVGPVWYGGSRNEAELLASCYRKSMALAKEHKIRTIAFPAISTGAYGFPPDSAAMIAVREARKALPDNPDLEKVIFVCFDRRMAKAYEAALAADTGMDDDE
ncbi:MAG: O-acetyl-ADP-ribose deacetylase [Desulfobulbaceae bacterium]|nr:O-acetyl-ADP-ribose deacetylase [Desulfobulbaceae bacterium]